MTRLETLIQNVEQWSRERGLDHADSRAQFLKVVEEVGEVAGALAKGKNDALIDGIGDVAVTLIILGQQRLLSLNYCLGGSVDDYLANLVTKYWPDEKIQATDPKDIFASIVNSIGTMSLEICTKGAPLLASLICSIIGALEILARRHSVTLEHCLDAAWQEIAHRTGKTVNGVFIKDEA